MSTDDKNQPDPWFGVRAQLAALYGVSLEAVSEDAATDGLSARLNDDGALMESVISLGSRLADILIRRFPLIPGLEPKPLPTASVSEPRHIELNFDELLKFLESCRALRREYETTAKECLDALLSLEEFFRADKIAKKEEEAGVDELDLRATLEQLAATKQEEVQSRSVADLIHNMFNELAPANELGPFTAPRRAGYIEDSRIGGSQSVPHNPPAAQHEEHARQDAVKRLADFRWNQERTQWIRTGAATSAELARILGTKAWLQIRRDYQMKEVGFRKRRRQIARDLAYSKQSHYREPGGPLNYMERLDETREIYASYFSRAIDRAIAVADGASTLYGLPVAPPVVRQHRALTDLCQWAVDTQEVLSKRKRRERVSAFAFSLAHRCQAFPGDMFEKSPDGLTLVGLRFDLQESDLGGLQGRLRGATLELVGPSGAVLSSFRVTPPRGPASLLFGRVVCASGPSVPLYADALWNVAPAGRWSVAALTTLPSQVDDVILVLFIADVEKE